MKIDIERAMEEALDGNAVLFVGAGFSKESTNINVEDSSFKTGEELARLLCEKCSIPINADLGIAAQFYQNKFGEDMLIELLKKEYTAKSISPSHSIVPNIPWRNIYTTNYDNVLEVAYRNASKRLEVLTPTEKSTSQGRRSTVCLHINGTIGRLDRNTLFNEFKLTNTSYLTRDFVDSRWAFLFREDIRLAKAVFFLGYSMYDMDIQRILYTDNSLSEKCFIVMKSVSETDRFSLSPFGEILEISTSDFLSMVENKRQNYIPQDKELSFLSFEEQSSIDESKTLTDNDVFDLFMTGNFDRYFISSSMGGHNAPLYYVERSETNSILDIIAHHYRKNILLYSELGNGKTLILAGVALKAINNGVRVFFLKETRENTMQEIDAICQLEGRKLVVIENYPRHIDLIKYFSTKRDDSVSLVVSARTSDNDTQLQLLDDALGGAEIEEFDVNQLKDSEVECFVDMLDHYGLWKQHAHLGRQAKTNQIINKYNR